MYRNDVYCSKLYSKYTISTAAVSIQQTVPDGNQAVCPGQELVFTCTTTTGFLRWVFPGQQNVLFRADTDAVNDTELRPHFTFQLTKIEMLNLTSTATSQMTDLSLNGLEIICEDGINAVNGLESLSVDVAGLCTHCMCSICYICDICFVKLVIP